MFRMNIRMNRNYCLTRRTNIEIGYCMDRVSFCNISVIQQDTQYLMINFIHNIQ